MSKLIGSVEKGKMADLVLWSPAFFGVKPDCIIKGGSIVAAPMGDPNASIPTPQPVHYQPIFAAFGKSLTASSVVFTSKAAVTGGLARKLGISKKLYAVQNTRGKISKNLPVPISRQSRYMPMPAIPMSRAESSTSAASRSAIRRRRWGG